MANQRFINAIKLTEQNVPPIWFMRQAGRYHKHYQTLKKKYSFEELCKTPELSYSMNGNIMQKSGIIMQNT